VGRGIAVADQVVPVIAALLQLLCWVSSLLLVADEMESAAHQNEFRVSRPKNLVDDGRGSREPNGRSHVLPPADI
jgi:hypothetical protein